MKVVLLADGPGLLWQERLEQAQRPVGAVWRIGRARGSACWERVGPGGVGPGGDDPWKEPGAWDVCVMVQDQRRQLLPFMLNTAPHIPTLLLTSWVAPAQDLAARQPAVRVICAANRAAHPEVLVKLSAMAQQLYAGVVAIGMTPPVQRARRRQVGSRYVQGF